ncbi:class I SAM-dependent methyltransferase [Microvirga roseola]|uniref:class I SAM-dependent methyltransferase n=1 Tax=Microvirga roseola TaxID=2883126 RepID=UPI001E4D38FF|nr:methyltransferase domain-containing protein [Microvirga roseola]
MDTEQQVARHYTHGNLESAILDVLRTSGKDVENLDPSDLSGADEFHLGWHAETVEFAKELGLNPGMHVFDIGAGIGGPARHFGKAHHCRVTGIDLTQEFVEVANALTRRCGLDDRVSFQQASALALPFSDSTFDAATMIHVGMNIADKPRLFSEARRVLKPGALFGVYDITHASEAAIPYPMPWAATEETSFVETLSDYRTKLEAAGFRIEKERDRSAFALELGRRMREKAATDGMPPLGLHTLMGPATQERLANVMRALDQGTIAPVEIIVRAI